MMITRVTQIGLVLLVAVPVAAQPPHIYTKDDLDKPLTGVRTSMPSEELIWLRAHAFVASPEHPEGPTVTVIPSDPLVNLPQVSAWPMPLDPNWVPPPVYGWPTYGYPWGGPMPWTGPIPIQGAPAPSPALPPAPASSPPSSAGGRGGRAGGRR